MKARAWLFAAVAGAVAGAAWLMLPQRPLSPSPGPTPWRALTEQQARARFLRDHPGERPLNWRIGEAAVALHRARPMGAFVLCTTWPDTGNDCSDFVACVLDEGLGAKARFRRDSDQHLVGQDLRHFESFSWDRMSPLLPGDSLLVAHSPWYEPYEGACWHVGIIGSEGMVYDFVKLRRWNGPRYGKHTVAHFVKHCHRPGEVVVTRLRPEYRYRLREVPIPADTGRHKAQRRTESDGEG